MGKLLLDYNPTTGFEEWLHVTDDDDATVEYVQRGLEKVIDRNKFLEAEGANVNADKSLHWYASIPLGVIHKWIEESGINLMRLPTKEFAEYAEKKVRDPEWRYLRVSSII